MAQNQMQLLNSKSQKLIAANNHVENGVLENVYDVFLGGSCGSTVWRSEIVITFFRFKFMFKII